MAQPHKENLTFLTEAMIRITGSLDIQKSLINTFDFLVQHFPIDAISLHQYSQDLRSLELLFLVQKDTFEFVEIVVPLSERSATGLSLHNQNTEFLINVQNNMQSTVSRQHGEALAPFLPLKERGYLIGILRSETETLGHLCFMGTHPGCFTKEHERKLSLLLAPFTLTMSNLLKYKRTMEFQKKLREEKDELQLNLQRLQGQQILGEHGGLQHTMDVVHQLRNREIPALILGETGTGKELIANVIQAISPRKNKPFVKVNCGAIPDTLVDSELFGYIKGAFTGATSSRPGRFEQAHTGTLFLDEIGELPLQAQVRLLRVLENHVVERIGSTQPIDVDVRIIAATNRNLELMMQEGTFREDLYYRLYVFPIKVPPLRERTGDLPELIQAFAEQTYKKMGRTDTPQIPWHTLKRLNKYSWPGNVRELENLVRRAITLSTSGPLQLDKLLPQDEGWYIAPEESQSYFEKTIDARVELALEQHLAHLPVEPKALAASQSEVSTQVKPLKEVVKNAIEAALKQAHGKIHGPGGAAELLEINPSTLRSKMRKMGTSLDQVISQDR
ncbi:AAA domain-containing protein [Pseudodesulfovibrio sp. JC047]|uniref:sigma-54 interaction domain-containing protein n=1 Tax=Pseudodesulfovibrio sp. JC047 TaxID=2683199 RepID=UPI0014063E7D|nr:sigma 54-interacting transcriptional regulator [Pseudodesulfovibrio sp. JC047]NDV19473.1 AAA domain-containing protein [Pseudodesulfovibrio sp. JC047]